MTLDLARFLEVGRSVFGVLLGLALSTLAVAGPNQAPTVTLTAPASGSQYAAPATVGLAATANDPDGSISKVEFYAGTQMIGSAVTVQPYAATWSNVSAGTYSLTAKAYDNLGKSTVSAAVQVTVYQPTIVITSPVENAVVPMSLGAAVQGTFTGPAGTSLIVSAGGNANATANTSGGPFTSYIDVQEGPNTIEVQVARPDGTSEIATRHVTGVAPPAAVLTTPTDCGPFMLPAAITFTAEAVSTNASIAKVEFLEGAAFDTKTSPPFVATQTFTTAGTHYVQVRVTDSLGQTSYSPYIAFTTASTPPAVTITSPTDGATVPVGSPTTIAATATDSDGISLVSFNVSDGRNVQMGGGATPYQIAWTPSAAGSYDIRVEATDGTGTSGSASITVTASSNLAPSVSISSPADGTSYNAPADIVIAATANDTDGSVAKVEFFADGALIGMATSSPYSVTWINAPAGNHSITAKATDDHGATTTSGAVSISVNGVSASLQSPGDGTTFVAPASFTLQATIATSAGNITAVDFLDGATLLQTITIPTGFANVTASQPLSGVTAGTHTYTVRGHDDGNRVGVSPAINVTVTAPLSVSMSAPLAGSFYIVPATAQVSADATPGTFPIAEVDFYAGSTFIGSATAAPYTTVWNTSTPGTYQLTATAIDDHGNQSTSPSVEVTVAAGPALTVDAGIDGVTVMDDNILVTGTVQGDGNTGVSVNGKTAVVDDFGHWAVNNVPLVPGANSLTIRAATVDGASSSMSITVTSSGVSPIALTVSQDFAVAPSDIPVLLSNPGSLSIKKVEFDAAGSGQFDDITALGTSFLVSYTVPALRIATIRVTTQDDITYTARAAIAIVGGQAMYQRVKGIIGGMLGKLQAGDVAKALNRITPDVAPTFEDVFNSLAQAGTLSASAAQFGSITEVSVGANVVEALLQRDTANGTEAYWLYLLRGSDGIWRIDSM